MSKVKLILSNSPSINVPIRFFFTALLFAVLAAIIMLWQGSAAFTSRWSPATLAITHILVLGYIGMIMQGALLQIVSVVLGKQPPVVERLSFFIHFFLSVGVVLLAWGFLSHQALMLLLSALLICLSFIIFLTSIVLSITGRKARGDTGLGIAIALFCVFLTLAMGVWLVLGYAFKEINLNRQLTNIHLAWGLLGWVGILVFTIAYEVVPMFQLTANYPALLTRWLGFLLLSGLILYSGSFFSSYALLLSIGSIIIALSLALFACTTLWLQYKRRKKQTDPTLWFWRIAMIILLFIIALWFTGQFSTNISVLANYPLVLGVLMIFGFILSLINGMLYKIIPFLVWLHLSVLVGKYKASRRLIPNIKKMLSIPRTFIQLVLHLLSIVLMLIWIVWSPMFFIPAVLSFAASNILLIVNLAAVLMIYNKTRSEILKSSMV